jgi:hypothetical protein
VLNDYQNLLDFDKVFVMHNGKNIEEGAPLDLLLERSPQVNSPKKIFRSKLLSILMKVKIICIIWIAKKWLSQKLTTGKT